MRIVEVARLKPTVHIINFFTVLSAYSLRCGEQRKTKHRKTVRRRMPPLSVPRPLIKIQRSAGASANFPATAPSRRTREIFITAHFELQ
jgi:hypothetical protein